MAKFKVQGVVADFASDKWVSKTVVYEADSEKEALKKFRYDYKVKDQGEPKVVAMNSVRSFNPVVQNALKVRNSIWGVFEKPRNASDFGEILYNGGFTASDLKELYPYAQRFCKRDIDYKEMWNEHCEKVGAKSLMLNAVACNAEGYGKYLEARSALIKEIASAKDACQKILYAIGDFEKDPMFNKDFKKLSDRDSAFARELIGLLQKFKA